MNRARKDPIWEEIRNGLKPILGDGVELVFPETWSETHLSWYREIEQSSFRPSLTYSEEEIMERLSEEDVLMMFITVDGHPEGLLLGYTLGGVSVETYYLDTIAVKQKGRGIGRIILTVLIKWAKKMGYRRMQLDTEYENEKGIPLSSFYEHLGFKIVDIDDEIGNITMQLTL
ncbi:MAG: GNAT family N-acetyltransferase [Candidatus Odinarchaeota archaeon]